MVKITLPRYVTPKPKKTGLHYYWNCPTRYRKMGSPFKHALLGKNLSQASLDEAAELWNSRLDEWLEEQRGSLPIEKIPDYGTLDWLCHVYQKHAAFTERVAADNRADYRRIYDRVCERPVKRQAGKMLGSIEVTRIGVNTAQTVYDALHGEGAIRSAEKAVSYCGTMWRRMQPLFPDLILSNPWDGVVQKRRDKAIKPAVDREEVYAFANIAIRSKLHSERVCAVAAVLCFEWHIRPENLMTGCFTWGDYRPRADPDAIRICHGKTSQVVWHPLSDDGRQLYPEAEAILKQGPRVGLLAICNEKGEHYHGSRLAQIVRRTADKFGMPDFTLDACRHGGMTELEEAGLTEGQGRALSAHKTNSSYRGYAKRTRKRVLLAAKKRRDHVECQSEQAENPNDIKEGKKVKNG